MIALDAFLEAQLFQNVTQICKRQIVIGSSPQQAGKNLLKFAHGIGSVFTSAIQKSRTVA